MTISRQTQLAYEPLRESMLPEIIEIEREAYPEPWTIGMFRDEMTSKRSYFRVARADGELIGYSGFWLVLDEAHITSVTVRRERRGLGYGRQQIEHLIDAAVRRGSRVATLEVRESNWPARKLYDAMGFRAVGTRKGYYARTNEDAIVMLLNLDHDA